MAITLGTFTKQDDNSFTGTLKTLNVTANLSIVPVPKASDNAPDHRVYAGGGQRYEVGAGWSQVAPETQTIPAARPTSTSRSARPSLAPPGRGTRPFFNMSSGFTRPA